MLEKAQCINRIKTIIKREFQRELENREKQLELIQCRITKAAKTLHLLRYCLVTTYYNRNELKFNASESNTSMLDAQNRIHPAVKRLLGDNPEIHTNLGLRKKRNLQKYSNNTVIQESAETTLKKGVPEENETSTDSPTESIHSENTVDTGHLSIRNRKLYKHQIVVGNISKWAPSESSDDNSTHKWMVYVRGPKEYPDITHIVEKVTFFLHPSYKPNDVIEVSKSPFHLSRRGWGEFPLRIQLNFHGKMNKPVDVIHNLVLDKTYTGRQTLGNETLIELSLYDLAKSYQPNSHIKVNMITPAISTNTENDIQEESVQGVETGDDDLQQEQMDIKVDIEPPIVNYINLDHSYCQSDNSLKSVRNKPIELRNCDGNKGCESNNNNSDDAVQIKKKRRPQQSLSKISIIKKGRIDYEEQDAEM
ncbi:hypothetical protein AMK59_6713 [Oryctes borbonicus]|uniref:YEATS domain-containing protein n=1 Tax=Oryctes borbonicus TaxID=1629725 RepID=A0A0T6AY23_9SCAR|nr:hypothetical protein AMK59_6713 [Oryctes borbonicus]